MAEAQEEIWIHPNRGQWHQNIQYKVNIPSGQLYLENNGFTYDLNNKTVHYDHAHDGDEDNHEDHEYGGACG